MIAGRNRVDIVLQAETNECGLACLAMLLNHHGYHVDLPRLRTLHPGDRSLSLGDLIRSAASFGLQSRALRCEISELNNLTLPAILHVDFDHYVILEKVSHRHVTIVDPARGRMLMPPGALSTRFTGVVLELQKSPDFQPSGRKKTWSALGFIRQLPVASLGRPLLLMFLLSLCIQAFALVSPFFLQIIVDEVLMATNLDLAHVVVLGFAAVYLVSAFAQWFRGLIIIQTGNQLAALMAAGLMRKLISLPVAFFQRRPVGDIVSRFSSMRPLQEFITHTAATMLLDLLMITTTLVMLACYSFEATLFIVITVAFYAVFQFLLMIPYRHHSHNGIVADAEVQTQFIESVQSIETLKRYEVEVRRTASWLNSLMVRINADIRAGRFQLAMDIGRYLFAGVTLLGVVYLSIDDVMSAALTTGMLYAIVAYTGHFSTALLSFVGCCQQYLMLPLHVQRLGDIVETAADERCPIDWTGSSPGIRISNLTFAYGDGRNLIEDFSFDIRPGEKIAIQGASGSGKSTLLKLLLGDEYPLYGEISLGGRLMSTALRPHGLFAALLQDDQLLNGTIIDNITYLDDAPDRDRLVRSARLACLHEDVMRMPLAYQEKVSENGHKLSAGQRQRLLIARTLYKKADVLLLDEMTSHLDRKTEQRVMENILLEPNTCIFITHSEAVAQLADHIIRLDPLTGAQSFATG